MPIKNSNFYPGTGKNPIHIGIIPDGTRRWARKNNVLLSEAYFQACIKLLSHVDFFFENGFKIVTLYLSSTDNFKRSLEEIAAFCNAEAKIIKEFLPPRCYRYGTRVVNAGNINYLEPEFRKVLFEIEQSTKHNTKTCLYLCIAYNPIEELLSAFKCSKSPESFLDYLWVREPLDLVIRTSGANLLSNFPPIQSGYARFYVLDDLFNDIQLSDIQKILTEFSSLTRLYGD